MGWAKQTRERLDVGIADADNRVRRATCLVQLTIFGGFGLVASLSVTTNRAFGPLSALGTISLVMLYVMVWCTSAYPRLWNWFLPGVSIAYALGVLQLASSAYVVSTPACLGVFWAAVFLSTRQVYVGTVAVSAAMLLQYIPLGFSLRTTISVAGALTSNAVAAVLFHSIVTSMRNTRVELEFARKAAVIHSLTDPLTGLSNRRWSPGSTVLDESAALLLIDIDHFKSINDRFGHSIGDAVLCEVAARASAVQEPLSEHFDVLRWGGDEFVVVARGARPIDVARSLGEGIRSAVAGRAVVSGEVSLPVSVSIGAVEWRRGDRLETALAHADHALYAAKHAGRNRVELASSATAARPDPPRASRYTSDVLAAPTDSSSLGQGTAANAGNGMAGPTT